MTVEEVWIPIKGFNKYAISNYGRVLNIKLNHTIKGHERPGGIRVALLNPKGKLEYRFLHRILAETFIQQYKPDKNYRFSEVMNMLPFELDGDHKFVPVKRRYIQVVGTDKFFETAKKAADYLDADIQTVYRLLKGELIWLDHKLKYVWR